MKIKPVTEFLIGLAGVDYNGYLGVIKDVAKIYDNVRWHDPNGVLEQLKDMFSCVENITNDNIVLVRMNDGEDRIYLYDESGFYVPEDSL